MQEIVWNILGSGVLSLAHLDEKSTFAFILEMLKSLEKLSIGAPEGRLNNIVFLVHDSIDMLKITGAQQLWMANW